VIGVGNRRAPDQDHHLGGLLVDGPHDGPHRSVVVAGRHPDGRGQWPAGFHHGGREGVHRHVGPQVDHLVAPAPEHDGGQGRGETVTLARRGAEDEGAPPRPPTRGQGTEATDQTRGHPGRPVLVVDAELAHLPSVADGAQGGGEHVDDHLLERGPAGEGGLDHRPGPGLVPGHQAVDQAAAQLGPGGPAPLDGGAPGGPGGGGHGGEIGRIHLPLGTHAAGAKAPRPHVAVDRHVVDAEAVGSLLQGDEVGGHNAPRDESYSAVNYSPGRGVETPPGPSRRVAVAGATGYVGRLLCRRLADAGHRVVGLARDTRDLSATDGVEAVAVDVGDPAACTTALAGVETAYYLVHAMGGGSGFAERDAATARAFGEAALRAGVRRIVYLGGLGEGELSTHLDSRREVGDVLRASGVEVVELRAAVVLGAGSISYEMLRSLTERLPVMVCPRWVGTRIQPLAEADLLAYLEGALGVPPGVYDVGTADATTYRSLMGTYAEVRGLARRRIVTVPLVTPRLSSLWVDLVSPVDRRVSHALVQSLVTDVVVGDSERTAAAFGFQPMTVRQAVVAAVDGEAAAVSAGLYARRPGRSNGIYTMRAEASLPPTEVAEARAYLDRIGGNLAWYPMQWAWRLRIALGRVLGERLSVGRPDELRAGAQVDWWTVVRADPEHLELVATEWWFGEGWLAWRARVGSGRLEQVAAMRPRGLVGLAYWQLLRPLHFLVFRVMVRSVVRRARRPATSASSSVEADERGGAAR